MTGALLAAAAALLLWPARPSPTHRLRASGSAHQRVGAALRWPSPLTAGCAVAAAGAVLSTPLVAVLAGGCAALASRSLAARRRQTEDERTLRALAEALGVLAAELAGGRDPATATAAAVAACPDEVAARALALAVRDPRRASTQPFLPGDGPLGAVLVQVRAGVALSRRTGSSLGAVLTAVEDDVRARHRRLQELRSATAGPRAGAALLAGLPVLGLAMGSGVGARPWAVLTATAAGQGLLTAGVVLEVLGVCWVGRLLRRAAAEQPVARGGG